MIYMSDDPARDAERYMADLDKKLAKRPVCDCCGDPIQEDWALRYNGVWICDECVEWHREEIEVDDEEL